MPADEALTPLRTSQKWTRFMDFRILATITLVLLAWPSGIATWWGHFDGCGLWSVRYPLTVSARRILRVLCALQILQTLSVISAGYIWMRRIKKWQHGVCSQMPHASRVFGLLMICDVNRALVELCSLFIFYGFYVNSVAEKPSGRVLLSWVVDLMAEGVLGVVPLVSWLLPLLFSVSGLFTLTSVWQEFCKQQTFNRRFSLYHFDKIVTNNNNNSSDCIDDSEGEVKINYA